MSKITALLACFLLLGTQDRKEQAFKLRREAIKLSDEGKRAGAIRLEKRALTLFKGLRDWENVAWSCNNLGFDSTSLGDSRSAVGHFATGLTSARKAGVAEVEDKILAKFIQSPIDIERMNPAMWRGSVHAAAYGAAQSGDMPRPHIQKSG